MADFSTSSTIKELHADLARKYRRHATDVVQFWASFTKGQRAQCLRAGAAEGVVLKHPLDTSLGNVYKIMPEYNLRDISTEPNHLLEMLKHRALSSLHEQYLQGVNDGPGDYELIVKMMQTRNLRHTQSFKNCYTFFLDDERHGESFEIMEQHAETLTQFRPAMDAGLCVPQSVGELVLQRQLYLLQSLTILVDDILDIGSQTRDKNERAKKSDQAASAAMSKLTIEERSKKTKKLSLQQLITSGQDQRDSLVEFLDLLSTEPVVLAHAVNIWFFTRPELIMDDKGRHLPVHTDKYISGAVFEAVHNAVKGAAIWNYICRLLGLLKEPNIDKVLRAVLLQELSNMCHLEYSRAQSLFKRQIQTSSAAKYFKRISNSYDRAGNAKVNMKIDPEELTRVDPQMHYVLRLCQPQTNASKAIDWIKRLSELHESRPLDRESLGERVIDALGDLIVITSFIHDLSPTISMPALSRKKGQMFVSRSQELDVELIQLQNAIDLTQYAVPIDNLREPGMAEAAMKELDRFIIESAGSKLGFLYQDLIEDCLVDIDNQYKEAKARLNKNDFVPLPVTDLQPFRERLEVRKKKEKTRPSSITNFEIVASIKPVAEEEPVRVQTYQVSPSTAQVFEVFFKKSEARGSISWVAFLAAMAELGFSIVPRFGSVVSFLPSEKMKVERSITVHRPHKSSIEGYLIPYYARRLNRAYGWTNQTFFSTMEV